MDYPEKINAYTESLIQNHGFPISYQVKKSDSEKSNYSTSHSELDDPTFEKKYCVYPNIIHKFKGRILVFFTDNCFCHCRFCFRRNRKFFTEKSSGEILKNLKEYLKKTNTIDEIIISGGDIFSLELKK